MILLGMLGYVLLMFGGMFGVYLGPCLGLTPDLPRITQELPWTYPGITQDLFTGKISPKPMPSGETIAL